jgi:hypothetical protein
MLFRDAFCDAPVKDRLDLTMRAAKAKIRLG